MSEREVLLECWPGISEESEVECSASVIENRINRGRVSAESPKPVNRFLQVRTHLASLCSLDMFDQCSQIIVDVASSYQLERVILIDIPARSGDEAAQAAGTVTGPRGRSGRRNRSGPRGV